MECVEGLSPQEQVEIVAKSFAAVSNLYEPMNLKLLPAHIPAEKPPQLSLYKVYKSIQKLRAH